MTAQEALHLRFPAVRQRMVALEHEIANWQHTLDGSGVLPQDQFVRAMHATQTAQEELRQLRELLAFWEANANDVGKIPLSGGFLAVLAALYLGLMAAALVYLMALVGG